MAQRAVSQNMSKIKRLMPAGHIGNIIHNGDHIPAQGINLPGMFGAHFLIGIMIKAQRGNIGIDNPALFLRIDQQHRRGIGHKKAGKKAIVPPLVAARAGMNRLILREQLHRFE